MTPAGLLSVVSLCWSRDTSSDPDHWSLGNPALGQCAVTALVVQDEFGGEMLRAMVMPAAGTPDGKAVSHYWNRIASDDVVDLTASQFPGGFRAITTVVERGRDYVLSHPETAARYARLRARVLL